MGLGTLWLAVLSWGARTLLGKLDGKADKVDLEKVLDRIDKQNEEARDAREQFYRRMDEALKQQQQFNLEVARHMGAMDGK